jgi:putative DNA primase/helicase
MTTAIETQNPELVLAVNARRALRTELLGKIAACADADVLASMLVPELDLATRAEDMRALRNDIKAAVQNKLKVLGGAKPTAADMREMFPDMVKKAKGSFSMTHHGVAQRVVAETDGDLRYNIDQEEWMQWDGRRWMTLRAAQVATLARNAANKAKADAAKDPNVDIDKLDVVDSDGFRRGVVGEMLAAERMHVEQRDLNAEVRYLACGNGAVDLHTGALVCERDVLVTVRNDTEFNPEATCPSFLRVLSEAFESREADIAYYELVMGYTVMGDPTERAMFFHKGEGLNGKSLLLGAIMKALGDYAAAVSYKVIADSPGATMNTSADGASPALRRLMDKRMAYIDELPLGGNLRDADVKLLAGGGGTVSARGLGKEAVEFPVTFVFHIACNSLPTIRGGQSAVWKRTYPIAFTKQFDKVEDPTLPAKLEAEREGILAWLVRCGEAYAEVHAQGGKLRDFMPQSALDELATLQSEQNPFTDWIASNCEVVQGAFMPAQQGWEDYVAYEAKVNLDGARSVRSVKAFVTRMKDQKAFKHEPAYGKGRKSGFLGIRLKSERTLVEPPARF